MAQTVFKRNEKKYVLEAAAAAALINDMQPYVQQDAYGNYTICSLYLDTADSKAAYEAENNLNFKEKMRLRSYGVPEAQSTVYLELKKKYNGVSYKRRMPLSLNEANKYLFYGIKPNFDTQVFGELDWFISQNNPQAKLLICYDRMAFCGKEDENLRITVDENIRWRNHDLNLAFGDAGRLLLKNKAVLEIKTASSIPLWLAQLLANHGAYAQSFSKFKTAHAAAFFNTGRSEKYLFKNILKENAYNAV